LFTLGSPAIARGSHGLFALAVAMASLNRETSVFTVLLYALAAQRTRGHVLRGGLFLSEWLAVYAGLRAGRGLQRYEYWQARRNPADLTLPLPAEHYDPRYRANAYFSLSLSRRATTVPDAEEMPGAPSRLRRVLVVPCVIAVAFMFSSIIETRIFTPFYEVRGRARRSLCSTGHVRPAAGIDVTGARDAPHQGEP
jgi:hypothetical protein